MKIQTVIGFLLCLALSTRVLAESIENFPIPAPNDTCPVCGMFVAKYPEWIASVLYKDRHVHHFDGAKDMFKYLFDLQRWAPGDRKENILTIGVSDYYSLKRIDARRAFYVIGSDVLGPMGHELVPLETEEDAQEFLQDHKGVRILRFHQVEKTLPVKLDNGVFE
jgi:copper chaperone NosL